MSPWLARCVSKVLLAIAAWARGLDLAARWRRWLTTALFDPYRPERYYMRGPGPKSQESHARAAGG
jgi:hypothetical protein